MRTFRPDADASSRREPASPRPAPDRLRPVLLPSGAAASLLAVQRAAGNRAATALLRQQPLPVQRQGKPGAATDSFSQKAGGGGASGQAKGQASLDPDGRLELKVDSKLLPGGLGASTELENPGFYKLTGTLTVGGKPFSLKFLYGTKDGEKLVWYVQTGVKLDQFKAKVKAGEEGGAPGRAEAEASYQLPKVDLNLRLIYDPPAKKKDKDKKDKDPAEVDLFPAYKSHKLQAALGVGGDLNLGGMVHRWSAGIYGQYQPVDRPNLGDSGRHQSGVPALQFGVQFAITEKAPAAVAGEAKSTVMPLLAGRTVAEARRALEKIAPEIELWFADGTAAGFADNLLFADAKVRYHVPGPGVEVEPGKTRVKLFIDDPRPSGGAN